MSTIDDRIVNMQFNNDQFQTGVADTNQSLQDLQKNLKLDGATSGLNSINNAANSMNLGTVAAGVERISNAFSVLGIIGINILSNITQSAFNAGKNIASAILSPIIEGGSRRALALEQAKFQFRGLGLDIEATMAAALAAVKDTAFGLDEAATAAAQFGASGITAGNGMFESLRAIAGVAAQTGSNYGDIARIFQGIASNGRVYGNDLLSLGARGVNAAALLAKSFGVSEEAARKMVSEGKISFAEFSKVMLDAFGENATKANETFQGALSNMKAALSRVGANSATPYFESLRVSMNALTPVIDQVAKVLKPLQVVVGELQGKAAAGLAAFLGGLDIGRYVDAMKPFGYALKNIFTIISKIGDAIGKGFQAIFPAPSVEAVKEIGAAIATFFRNLIPTDKAMMNLRQTAGGFFAILSIGWQIIVAVVKMLANLVSYVSQSGTGIGDFTAKIGVWLMNLDAAIKKGDGLTQFFSTLGGYLAVPIGLIQTFFGILADGWTFLTNPGAAEFQGFLNDTGERFAGLAKIGEFFKDFWNGIVTVASAVWSFLQPIFKAVGDAISTMGRGIADYFDTFDLNKAISGFNAALFIAMITAFFGNLKGVLEGQGIAFVSQFNLLFGGLRTNLKALEMNTNAKTLTQIAIAVALLAASAVALSLVDTAKMLAATVVIVGMVEMLMAALQKMLLMTGEKGIINMFLIATTLQVIAGAVLTLAAAVALLSMLPFGKMMGAVLGVVILIGALAGALWAIGKIMEKSGPSILAGAAAIVIVSQAVMTLVLAVVALAFIPLANLAQGVGAVIILLAALVGVVALLGVIMKKNAAQILLGAAAMYLIGNAVLLMAGAVAILGALGMENLIAGMIGLAAALVILTVASKLMGSPMALLGAAAMIIMAIAVTILAGALKIVATMSWDDIGRTMVVLAGALLILAAAAYAFTFAAVGAAAMLVVAGALYVLVPALMLLSLMSWESFGTGIGILAAALGILAVAGLLLIPASVGFLLLGVAVLALGAGVMLASIGISALAIGIGLLVTVGSAGIAMFIEGIKAFAAQIPLLAVAIGKGMVAMAVTIGESAPELIGAFVSLLMAMLEAIGTVVPEIIAVATEIIVSLVEALLILIPLLVDAGLQIIVGILKGIGDNIGGIVTEASNIIINFLNALADKLPDIIAAGGNLILSYINGMATYISNNSAKFTAAGLKLFNAIVDGIARAIEAGGAAIRRAGERIGLALIQGAKNALGIASPSKEFTKIAAFAVEGLGIGMSAGTKDVEKMGTNMGDTAIKAVTKSMSKISDAVSSNIDVTPTIRPVLDLSAVKKDASQINGILSARSISLDKTTASANSANFGYEENRRDVTDADGQPTGEGTVFNYTQINNSPKAISEVETYRNTKNLLSIAKGERGK